MKKILTTAFCASVLLLGTQGLMEAKADVNTASKNAKTTTATKILNEQGQKPNFDKRPPRKPPMFNLEEELNLTDAQKAKAKANRIKGRKEMKPIMDEIRAKKEAVLDVMDSDLSQEEQQLKIKDLQNDIKKLHEKANAVRKNNMNEFEKILTKEQKAKFEKMKKEHEPAGRCKKCERMMPPPPLPPEEQ